MKVLVDTSVWSLALRRHQPESVSEVEELQELILEGRAEIIGPVRQELLSGIRHEPQFQRLRRAMRAFSDLEISSEDHESAAGFYNQCRSRGVQGSNTDFLICAVADRRRMSVLTTDADFAQFAEHLPIRLHQVRREFDSRDTE